MISHYSLKEEAKKIAWSNKWKIISPVLIYFVFAMILTTIVSGGNNASDELSSAGATVTNLVSILLTFLTIGYYRYLLAIARSEEFELRDILTAKVTFASSIVLSLLITIFVLLWSLLFIIPGIIAALSYAMALYLMADDYTIKPMAAIKQSKMMMEGYKMDLFLLNLSFIPWIIFGAVTFGVALVWAIPYITMANILYYEKLKQIKGIN